MNDIDGLLGRENYVTGRKLLGLQERLAIQAELKLIQGELESQGKDSTQQAIGELLGGLSQPAIGKAMNHALAGPIVRDAVLNFRGMTREDLLARHRVQDVDVQEGLRELVRELIEELGGQKQVAERLGVSQGYVSEFINGGRGGGAKFFVAVGRLYPDRLAAVLGLPESDGQPMLENEEARPLEKPEYYWWNQPAAKVLVDFRRNRGMAVLFLLSCGEDESAVRSAANRAASGIASDEALSPLEWANLIQVHVKAARSTAY